MFAGEGQFCAAHTNTITNKLHNLRLYNLIKKKIIINSESSATLRYYLFVVFFQILLRQ